MISFIILLTFSILIHSEPLLSSPWNEADCEGPPSSMHLFSLSSRYSYDSSEFNETWPDSYWYWIDESGVDFCNYAMYLVNEKLQELMLFYL